MFARQDEEAEKTLEEAFYKAEAARHDEIAARAAVLLVTHVGLNRARLVMKARALIRGRVPFADASL